MSEVIANLRYMSALPACGSIRRCANEASDGHCYGVCNPKLTDC